MELDHVFIRARRGAPEADLLAAFGLSEGSGNQHPGQGTANRRFFFQNAFIELLWIADQAEITSAQTRPTPLFERLSGSDDASPFGVCFRPAQGATAPDFPAWRYLPRYLPARLGVDIADTAACEPMWFFLSFAIAPECQAPGREQPLAHAAGLRRITSLAITQPSAARGMGGITVSGSGPHLMEIGFDHGVQGRVHDFRPGLPLVFSY